MNRWDGDIAFYNKVEKGKGVLLEGLPKSGKTTFASTAPKPVFLDSDGGGESLKAKNIPFIPIRLRMDEEEKKKYQTPYRKVLAYVLWAKDQKGPFESGGPLADRETLVFDSMTNYCHIEWIRLHEVMGVDLVAQGKVSQFDPCWQQLRNGLIYINSLLRDIKESGVMNVISITHLQSTEKAGQTPKGEAAILGGFRGDIDGYYDDILHTEVIASKYLLHSEGFTTDGVIYEGGHRTLGLQKRIEDPSWSKLYGSG